MHPVGTLARQTTPLESAALLDAVPDATAVLSQDGTIVAVNRTWRMFATDNGGTEEMTGIGVNYIDVCSRSAAAGCADASEVEAGLRAVLTGDVVEYDLEYPCPSSLLGRWFVLRATRIAGEEPRALVSHVNITRRKMAEQYLERRASEDPLTGLANRALFFERLSSALTLKSTRATHPDVGLLFIDLDGFKEINDNYGHAAGDEVLQVVGSRLDGLARPQDTVARLGGDEFSLLAPRISTDGLGSIAARVHEMLGQPHFIYGIQLKVGASVGTYLAERGENAVDALRRADEAMYCAKVDARARF